MSRFSSSFYTKASVVILTSFNLLGGVQSADESIYGDHAPEKKLTPEEQQGIVATLTILLFVLMAMEITSPEVLFLIALIIVIMCEILTLKEGLAGEIGSLNITTAVLTLCMDGLFNRLCK